MEVLPRVAIFRRYIANYIYATHTSASRSRRRLYNGLGRQKWISAPPRADSSGSGHLPEQVNPMGR